MAELRAPDDYAVGRETLLIRDEADKARFGRDFPLTDDARAALDRVCPASGLLFGDHDVRIEMRRAAVKVGIDPARVTHLTRRAAIATLAAALRAGGK